MSISLTSGYVFLVIFMSSKIPHLIQLHRELLVNETGQLRQKGEFIKMPKLARTLERIRDNPEDFYTGELAKDIVKEITEAGGLITLDDLKNYKVKIKNTLVGTLGDYHWYSMPPPGSGCVMGLILNILKGLSIETGIPNSMQWRIQGVGAPPPVTLHASILSSLILCLFCNHFSGIHLLLTRGVPCTPP